MLMAHFAEITVELYDFLTLVFKVKLLYLAYYLTNIIAEL